jgi:hypothetical protein
MAAARAAPPGPFLPIDFRIKSFELANAMAIHKVKLHIMRERIGRER